MKFFLLYTICCKYLKSNKKFLNLWCIFLFHLIVFKSQYQKYARPFNAKMLERAFILISSQLTVSAHPVTREHHASIVSKYLCIYNQCKLCALNNCIWLCPLNKKNFYLELVGSFCCLA